MTLMYVMMEVVVLFWVVGVATGMVSVIFLLELEDKYILQPTRYFFGGMGARFSRIVSPTHYFFKEGLSIDSSPESSPNDECS